MTQQQLDYFDNIINHCKRNIELTDDEECKIANRRALKALTSTRHEMRLQPMWDGECYLACNAGGECRGYCQFDKWWDEPHTKVCTIGAPEYKCDCGRG
jgi:hypothetical protein